MLLGIGILFAIVGAVIAGLSLLLAGRKQAYRGRTSFEPEDMSGDEEPL